MGEEKACPLTARESRETQAKARAKEKEETMIGAHRKEAEAKARAQAKAAPKAKAKEEETGGAATCHASITSEGRGFVPEMETAGGLTQRHEARTNLRERRVLQVHA